MTRAKQNLIIHINGNYLDNIIAQNLERVEDDNDYLPPNQLSLHLSHGDINLGFFEFVQHRLNDIFCGDFLKIVAEGCANANGDLILKFSKKFQEQLNIYGGKGYTIKEVKVNFILYWKKKDDEKEFKIILPELYLEK